MVYYDESQDEAAHQQHGSLEAAQEAQTAIPARDVDKALADIEGCVEQYDAGGLGQHVIVEEIKAAIIQARRDLGIEREEVIS